VDDGSFATSSTPTMMVAIPWGRGVPMKKYFSILVRLLALDPTTQEGKHRRSFDVDREGFRLTT